MCVHLRCGRELLLSAVYLCVLHIANLWCLWSQPSPNHCVHTARCAAIEFSRPRRGFSIPSQRLQHARVAFARAVAMAASVLPSPSRASRVSLARKRIEHYRSATQVSVASHASGLWSDGAVRAQFSMSDLTRKVAFNTRRTRSGSVILQQSGTIR